MKIIEKDLIQELKDFPNELETLGKALLEACDNYKEKANTFLSMIEDTYVPVHWPDFQVYMEEEWFYKEAILDASSLMSPSTYLIPTKYLL